MSTNYPNNVDSFTVHQDGGIENVDAAYLNNLQDAVVAIEQTLGYGPTRITSANGFAISGLAGATTPTRIVGGTNGGAPTTGTWNIGDEVTDITGAKWICTVAGTPGIWVKLGVKGYEFTVFDLWSPSSTQESTTSTSGIVVTGRSVLLGKVSPDVTYVFEADLIVLSGGTGYVSLYDVTASSVVASSTLSTTVQTEPNILRTGPLQLIAGHNYTMQLTTSSASYTVYVTRARVVGQV